MRSLKMKLAIRIIQAYCAKHECRYCDYGTAGFCLFQDKVPCDWVRAIERLGKE